MQRSFMQRIKTQIRLCRCTGWFESPLGAHIRRYVFSCCGLYIIIYYYVYHDQLSFSQNWGWLGVAKVLCILCHRGIQLILAYSWARPAILVAGKGRGGMFYFFNFFTFIPVPLSSLSLSFISCTISSISFLPFSGRQHKMTHKGWCVVKPQHNQFSQNYFTHLYSVTFEPAHDKSNEMDVRPAKTDQPWHPHSLISLCCVLSG